MPLRKRSPVNGIKMWLLFFLLWLAAAGLCPGHAAAAASERGSMPSGVRRVLAKVGVLMDRKDYDRAIETLNAFQHKCGLRDPSGKPAPAGCRHPEIYFVKGTCHLLQDDCRKAARAFEKALKQDPGHVPAWLNLAKAVYDLKDYARAAECFAEAYHRTSKKRPEHLYLSAVAHLMAGGSKLSIVAFEILFKDHPDKIQPAWRENYVYALLNTNLPRRALPHIQWLAERNTGDKQVRWQEILLYQYLQLDMRREAFGYVDRLTGQAPTRARWWKALAHVHLHCEQYKPALTALTVYGYLEPLSTQETTLLADLHLQLGIPVKAAPLYEAVLAEKTDIRLVHNLMLAMERQGQSAQALAMMQRFSPGTRAPELLMLKANLLYNLERYAEAARTYRQTAEIDTRHKGRAWLMAGYAAVQANDLTAGRRAFQKAATFKRHRKAARKALQRLCGTEAGTHKKFPETGRET